MPDPSARPSARSAARSSARAFALASRFLIAIAAVGLATAAVRARRHDTQPGAGVPSQQPAQRSRMLFDRPLPAMDGAHLTMKVVEVRFAPGESSPPHKHGCAVVVYVVDGAVRMQVRGGPDSTYHRGETFHERPTDIHQVSANASATDSARITATLLCDHAGPLSVPVTDGHSAAMR